MLGHRVFSTIVVVTDGQLRTGCSWRVSCLPGGAARASEVAQGRSPGMGGLERVRRMGELWAERRGDREPVG